MQRTLAVGLAWVVFSLLWSPMGARGNADDTEGRIVLLSPLNQKDVFSAILENTRSLMVGMPLSVTAKWIDRLPQDHLDVLAMATSVLHETGASLVFWYDNREKDQVSFLYVSGDRARLTVRGLEGSGEEGVADAVAIITQTTVESLLGTGRLSPGPSETSTAEKQPGQPPPTDKSIPEPASPVRMLASLSYFTEMATPSPQFTHGGRLSVDFAISSVFRVFVGSELSTPVEGREPEASVSIMRFPAQLGVWALASMQDWRLGGGVTAVFSAVKTTPRSFDPSVTVDAPFYRFVFAAELFLRAEYRIFDSLAVFLGVGIEIFPEKTMYRVTNGPTLFEEVLQVQPKLMVGVTIFLI